MDVATRYHALQTTMYPWFEHQWQRVNQLIEANKLPHALIVNGSRGIGKLHFAACIAQLMLCQQVKDRKPCGQCHSCQLFGSSGHPDLYHLTPEDGAQIKVDQVRDLSSFMQSTAQQGGYRVVILDPAEAMNISAANALLKTLEEPGEKSLLLLLSNQLGQVMPTIKSRCQRIDCPKPDSQIAAQWLASELSLEQQDASQLLKVVHGAPLLGLDFKESGEQALRAEFIIGLKSILQQKISPLELAGQLAKADVLQLISWMYSLLVDISKLHLAGTESKILNTDMLKMLSTLAKRSQIGKVHLLANKVQGHRAALLARQNPNKQLLLEDLLLDWKNLI